MQEGVLEFVCMALHVERAVASRPSSSTACVVGHALAEALPQAKQRLTINKVKYGKGGRLVVFHFGVVGMNKQKRQNVMHRVYKYFLRPLIVSNNKPSTS